MKGDRLDTGDEIDDYQSMFCIIDGIVNVWVERDHPADDELRLLGFQPLEDPYLELSILQFERGEISGRITELLQCMKEVEGATGTVTQAGSAVPVSQQKDQDSLDRSSD
jgi:hypothetical protein